MSTHARFVDGSIMRHLVSMASTSTIGLLTIFMVDLVDMYFLSLLGEVELAAAVGYAGSILFFTTSICIGISIASGALISRNIGRGNMEEARRFASSVYIFGFIFTIFLAALVWHFSNTFLALLGASGRTLELGAAYLNIIIPSMPVLLIGMCSTSVLRSIGAAKYAMYCTIVMGLVNAVLDPIFIFTFGLGIEGAAWASVAARFSMMAGGLYGAVKLHNMIAAIDFATLRRQFSDISHIALPAMLTNIATPIGNAYVTAAIAEFGDGAVAAMSVIGRVIPVAFAAVFALSGAVGPIAGQNFGAGAYDRVRATLYESIKFTFYYVVIVSLILWLLRDHLVSWFSLGPDSGYLVIFFCTFIGLSFLFNGMQFIGNAMFNNLGFPKYSTLSNFGKATLGTIPVVSLGAFYWQAKGVLIGQAIGSIIFGLLTVWVCARLIDRLEKGHIKPDKKIRAIRRFPLWPFSSNRG